MPIAISAFTQEDLTRSQVAGGPDLMTQVPNLTFTKTNFSRLLDPDPRHRHPGHFGDDRPGRGGRVQQHALHPQPLLRAGILRPAAGRGAARAARHALRPQRHGRRRQHHLAPSRSSSSRPSCRPMSATTTPRASRGWSTSRWSRTRSRCASPAPGPSATATSPTSSPATRSTAATCGPRGVSLRVAPTATSGAELHGHRRLGSRRDQRLLAVERRGGHVGHHQDGNHFTGATSVRFNGTSASFSFVNDDQVTVTAVPDDREDHRHDGVGDRHQRVELHRHRGWQPRPRQRRPVDLGSVRIRSRRGHDGYSACSSNVPVVIKRLHHGEWHWVTTTSTHTDGDYRALIGGKDGRYRAKAKKITLVNGTICEGQQSSTVQHH